MVITKDVPSEHLVCSCCMFLMELFRQERFVNKLRAMAKTFTQLYIQYIFAVKSRAACIQASWKEMLHKYITGIFHENKHKMLQINSMPDHIHILIGLNPEQSISAIIQNVKTDGSKWINDHKLTPSKFAGSKGTVPFLTPGAI